MYPGHLNPNVQEPVYRILGSEQNIILCEPLLYYDFVLLLTNSHIVLTDSGGIQEAAPSLDVPMLVVRNTTEPPEGVEADCAKLIGVTKESIVEGVSKLFSHEELHRSMAEARNPFGEGHAAQRIVDLL